MSDERQKRKFLDMPPPPPPSNRFERGCHILAIVLVVMCGVALLLGWHDRIQVSFLIAGVVVSWIGFAAWFIRNKRWRRQDWGEENSR